MYYNGCMANDTTLYGSYLVAVENWGRLNLMLKEKITEIFGYGKAWLDVSFPLTPTLISYCGKPSSEQVQALHALGLEKFSCKWFDEQATRYDETYVVPVKP